MKKIALFLTSIIIFAQTAYPQIKWAGYSQSYQSDSNNAVSAFSLIIAIPKANNSFWVTNGRNALYETLSRDSLFMANRSRKFIALTTFDTSEAQFFVNSINRTNADKFEFRILENQSTILVPWTNITKFTTETLQTESGLPEMAYLGGYKTKIGSKIIADIRKKGDNKILTSAVVRWVPISPILLNIYTANELNDFYKRLKEPGAYRMSEDEINKWKQRYPADQLDKITSLPVKLKVAPTDNNLIFYLRAEIYSREQVEYELIKDQKVFRSWDINEFDNCFIWLRNLSPGEYLLKIRYAVQRENVTEYPFLIETAWYQSAVFKIFAGILTVAFIGFVVFLILLLKQKQKTARELSIKTKLQLELKTIYAQLNPHFVFNALSSIQGLINKQDIQGANKYLADFARLMRDSLTNNNKDLITLREEILTLETYLNLEQLRFGFKYFINVNEINTYETEMPSLLLQPLIENAVKHGISSLKEKGVIDLEFKKSSNDMIVTIRDNGVGFQYNENLSGFGLKLTRDRLKLLNQILKEQTIELNIPETPTSGSIVSLTFKNWLL